MKRITTTAAALVLLGAILTPATAQDRPGATPPKTMGDEGKLPATDKMTGQVPDMGATTADPNTATPPGLMPRHLRRWATRASSRPPSLWANKFRQ